jgi:hypothetical protein
MSHDLRHFFIMPKCRIKKQSLFGRKLPFRGALAPRDPADDASERHVLQGQLFATDAAKGALLKRHEPQSPGRHSEADPFPSGAFQRSGAGKYFPCATL